MYNGIGLQTPRGSGTNGHVQRNWAIVRKTKDKCDYKAEEKLDLLNKPPNQEILDHVRKRKIEVKCAELADILEDQGLAPDEVKTKVAAYRKMLMGNDAREPVSTDDSGRVDVRETHQVAEAQQEKNAKLREAFGISEFFVEGSSLDPERHVREAEARAAANQVYELVPSPILQTEVTAAIPTTTTAAVAMEKKVKRKRSGSGTKKRKGKKHKKDRSESPKSSKKKDKSRKKRKEKEKKHKKTEASSSESETSDDTDDYSSSEVESKKKKKKKKKKKSKCDSGKEKHEKKKAAAKRKRQYTESSADSSPEKVKKLARQDKTSDKIMNDATLYESRQAHSPKLWQARSVVDTPPPSRQKNSPTRQSILETKEKSPIKETSAQGITTTQAAAKRSDLRLFSKNHGERGRSPRRYFRSQRASRSPRRRRVSRSPRRASRYSMSRSRSRSRSDRYSGGSRRRRSPPARRRSRSRNRSPRRSKNHRERSKNRHNSRSRTRSYSKRSSLSYSPIRRNPDRYRDLLDDRRRQRKSEDKKQKSRSVSRSRKPRIIPPRVSLRSSSEEEPEVVDDDSKQQEDEERQNEINTLKRLQSGLAAKARETLGKKVISPIKIKTERKEESILDIALPAESPKTTVINQSMKFREESISKSPIPLNLLKSVESSRSPSPALPLTREEAIYAVCVKTPTTLSMSPIAATVSVDEQPIKLRSPTESPPHPFNQLNNSLSRSQSPTTRKSPTNKRKFYPRSGSRSYSRSVSRETKSSRCKSSARYKTSESYSRDKKSISPKRLSRSPSRTKESVSSVRSKHSRSSRSSSMSKCSISRSRSRSKKSNSRSPRKPRSRSSTRSVSKRSKSHSLSKKSHSRSRSISRDKQKRSRSRSSSNSSRSSTGRNRRSFSSSSRSSSSASSRSSRSTSSSSGSSRSRSPSIPRRHGSPSFLDRRRITSARKRPIPYHRPTPSPQSSPSSSESSRQSDWSSPSRRSSHSLTRSPSYNH